VSYVGAHAQSLPARARRRTISTSSPSGYIRKRKYHRPFGSFAPQRALGDCQPFVDSPPWPQSVEDWRPLVTQMADGIPVEFLLAWIDIESCGNACDGTYLGEVGIFQLEPGDNIAEGGTTTALQHPNPPCVSNAYIPFAALASAQQNEQVRAGIQYVNYCRTYAHAALEACGATTLDDEGNPDFWACVKMVHVIPSAVKTGCTAFTAANGAPPETFADLIAYMGQPANRTQNAQWVGSFGTGGGSILSSLMPGGDPTWFLAGIGAIAAWYYFT